MNQLISFCGINCEACEAREATLRNDDVMRREIAEKWSSQYQATITAEMINCTGCRMEGVKVGHWNECGIRLCAVSKGYEHCGQCADISSCANIKFVLDHVSDALQNLKSL